MNADECEEYPRQESIGMKSNLVFEMIVKYIPESSNHFNLLFYPSFIQMLHLKCIITYTYMCIQCSLHNVQTTVWPHFLNIIERPLTYVIFFEPLNILFLALNSIFDPMQLFKNLIKFLK